jgi:hypothetical protein
MPNDPITCHCDEGCGLPHLHRNPPYDTDGRNEMHRKRREERVAQPPTRRLPRLEDGDTGLRYRRTSWIAFGMRPAKKRSSPSNSAAAVARTRAAVTKTAARGRPHSVLGATTSARCAQTSVTAANHPLKSSRGSSWRI